MISWECRDEVKVKIEVKVEIETKIKVETNSSPTSSPSLDILHIHS